MKAKQPALSTVIRKSAGNYEYHASKHKGLWYIKDMVRPSRPIPGKGLTDEQALAWLLIYKD